MLSKGVNVNCWYGNCCLGERWWRWVKNIKLDLRKGKWTTISLIRGFWYQWCYTFGFGNQTFTARRSVQPIAINLTNVPTVLRDRLCEIFISVVSYDCLSFTRIRRSNITSSLKMLSLNNQEVLHCCGVFNYFPCRWRTYQHIDISTYARLQNTKVLH